MKRLVLLGLGLVLVVPNAAIVHKERVLATGTPMLLELAPVDPRSLIQGDYMRLDYALVRTLPADPQHAAWPRHGKLVVTVDSQGVARFVRRHDASVPLAAAEHLLTYRRRDDAIRVGSDAFFFQEGHAPLYESARYGELRVAPSGTSVLVGLRDADRRRLGPE